MSRYFSRSEKNLKMQICIGNTRYYLTPVVEFFTWGKRNYIETYLEGFLLLPLCKYVELQVGADVWVVRVGVLIQKVEHRRTLKPGLASLSFKAKEKAPGDQQQRKSY